MEAYDFGLRCQDVNSGLRNFDATSPTLSPLKQTRLVGMAADLAALVRETELISNMNALESVAAQELDIPPTSFDSVLGILEEVGFVELTRTSRNQITGLTSEVPHYRNLYTTLGECWRNRLPSQLEEELVYIVNRLASGPIPRETLGELGVDTADVPRLLDLGTRTQLIQTVSGIDGAILYSPYTAFENPRVLSDLAEKHGNDQLLSEFDGLRRKQGLAVTPDRFPLLYDAVGHGLLLAPSVELPNGSAQAFATLPYTLDRGLLKGEKPILDKALAVVACIRCGEEFGGYSNLPSPVFAIDKLLREGVLAPHSSSARQYLLMRNKGIVAYGKDPMPWGSWIVPTLIDTPDNRRALQIARDLITLGEPMVGRDSQGARELLASDARYMTPMKTVAKNRPRLAHQEPEYAKIMAAVMGWGAL